MKKLRRCTCCGSTRDLPQPRGPIDGDRCCDCTMYQTAKCCLARLQGREPRLVECLTQTTVSQPEKEPR